MKQLLKKAKYILVLVLAVSYIGCEEVENLFPDVTSAFTYTVNEDTGTVTFINISEDAKNYLWNFGDGTTSIEINPIKSYSESGTYTVTLKATNEAGASDSSEDQVIIVIATPSDDCTAETEQSLGGADFNITFQTDPGSAIVGDGAAYSYIDNPDPSGINTSCKVGEIVRDASLPFANNQIEVDAKFDFNANAGFKLKVWAPAVGTNVLLKLEDKTDAGINTEVAAVTTTANAWEELTFDFPGTESGKYDKIVLFFDINTDSGATYYIDDFALYGAGGGGETCDAETEQSLGGPVDFEGCETFLASQNFGGGITSQLIVNPFKTGINTSDFVLEVDKPTGSDFFAGIQNTFGSNFDLTTTNVFKLKIYSTKANAIFRFELLADPNDGSIGNPVPVYATVANANEWTEVEFTFTGLPAGPTAYNQLVIKPDNDQTDSAITNGATYYLDDLTLNAPGGGGGNTLEDCGGDLVNDFETDDNSIFNNFGGGVGTIIDNPDTSVNTSAKVGQYVKNAGEVFGGITIEVDPDIDFNAGVFSIDVSSQAVRQLLFKLEGLNIEQVIPTSGTGWETITYDFSSVGGNIGAVTAITLIMDNGTAGDGSADWTIQFDNIRLCSNESTGGGNTLEDCGGDLVNDFETDDNSIFNNFGGGVGTIIDNPDTSVNTSAKVGQYVKNAGEVFGGITIEVDPDIDFNAGVFSIDVSSQAVRQLLFKLEGLNIEQVIPTSGTGWETITYDFSSVGGNIGAVTAITLIMDNGTAGDGSGDWTIQFDNIRLCSNGNTGGGTGGNLAGNGDFETGTEAPWLLFQNGGAAALDNTISNGGTWSGRLATGGPSNPGFKQERIGAGTVMAGDVVQVQFDHIGSVVQPGAVFNVLLFGEGAGVVSFTEVLNPAPTLTTSWTTYTASYTIPGGTDVSEGVSVLIQAVCGGDAGCSVIANIDNVSVTLNP